MGQPSRPAMVTPWGKCLASVKTTIPKETEPAVARGKRRAAPGTAGARMTFEVVHIGDATLIRGDCMEVLPTLGRFDAVITDPPYGINWKPRVNHQDQAWIDVIDFDVRALLVGEFNLIWGGQYFADKLPVHEGWLTWCKRPIDMDFSNDNRSYATTEIAWRDWGKAKFYAQVWDGGMRAGAQENREFCHPSQKPVELMNWCVRQLPGSAQTILDPFMGSGTTGVACAQLGRKFTGIEREQKYFDIAVTRIQQAYNQRKLFDDENVQQVRQEQMVLGI